MDIVGALRASALFKGFTDTGLNIIGAVATRRTFPAGVPLFVENMVADALLIVEQGTVKLSTKLKSGEEAALGEVGPGDHLGELSLIQEGQRMCTATAVSPVTAVEIRHSEFQKLMSTKPQACIKLLLGIVSGFGLKLAANRDAIKSLVAKS